MTILWTLVDFVMSTQYTIGSVLVKHVSESLLRFSRKKLILGPWFSESKESFPSLTYEEKKSALPELGRRIDSFMVTESLCAESNLDTRPQ